jgi:hypothetical protein
MRLNSLHGNVININKITLMRQNNCLARKNMEN